MKIYSALLLSLMWSPFITAAPTLDINLKDTAQKTINLSSYLGHVVYVDFWASWCGPCRKSFTWMNQIEAKYAKQGLKIVAINLDTEKQDALKFLTNNTANFTVLFDPKGDIAKTYDLLGMPSSYLFDKEGNLASQHTGFFQSKTSRYEQEIAHLLGN